MSALKKGQLMTLEYSFKLFANQYLFSGFVWGPSFPFIISHGAQTAYQQAWRQITALKEQLALETSPDSHLEGRLSSHYSGNAKGFKVIIIMPFTDAWTPLYVLKEGWSSSACKQLGLSPSYNISHECRLPFSLPHATCQEVLLHLWVSGFGVCDHLPPSLNCSSGTNLFGTGRPWVDRWPEPQLSIWPVKLSKKASSLQIRALISLPTVWPVGVSGLCQGGEEEENCSQGVGRAREGGRCLQGPVLRMGLVLMARRQGRTALLAGPKGLHWALLWGEVSKINPWNHWSKPLDNCV